MINRYTKQQKIKNGHLLVEEKTVAEYPTHWHEFYEIEIILSGDGTYVIDGVERKIEKNMLFFMTPVNFHKVVTKESKLITLMFMGEACDKNMLFRLVSAFNGGIKLKDVDADYLVAMLRELKKSSSEGDLEYAFHVLNSILGKICRLADTDTHSYISNVQEAILYIHNNFRNELSLEDIAEIAGVAPTYMSNIFRQHCGVNFKNYLNGIRFDYAKKLLEHSDMSVMDICLESGFNDYANFERNFKSKFGVSPRQYRKGL